MNRYGQLDDPLVNWVANSVIATDEFVDGQDYKKRKDDILENPLERIDLDDKYTWKIAREITNSEDITSISIAIENLYKFTENRPTNQTIGDLIEQCESKTCEEGIYKSVHLLSSFVFIANKYGLSTNKLLGDICIDRKRRNEILTEYTRFYEQASKLGYKIKKPVLTLDAYVAMVTINILLQHIIDSKKVFLKIIMRRCTQLLQCCRIKSLSKIVGVSSASKRMAPKAGFK